VKRAGGAKPQRIGLSATVRPLEAVAHFLSPTAEIVDVGSRREMTLAVEVPSDELGAIASSEMWAEIYDRVAALVLAHKTTLVFVSTRRMSERVTFALSTRLGEGVVLPHHGSLSRDIRFDTENRLKNGELRAVVATASLELGIDIGAVDLVVQLGSPRSIAVALQRVGRSGHWIGAKPEGRLFATTRDELIECGALVHAMRGGAIDALCIPHAPLDVLAQQLVATCAGDDWNVDELYTMVRATYPYRDLARKDFDDVLAMLADGITTARGRYGAFLHHDRVNERVRARRGSRMAAITSGGAIPETANYNVVAEPDGQVIGTVDEDFAVESMAGDVFLLGTTSWMIRRVESGVGGGAWCASKTRTAHRPRSHSGTAKGSAAPSNSRTKSRSCAARSTNARTTTPTRGSNNTVLSRVAPPSKRRHTCAPAKRFSARSRPAIRSWPSASSTRAAGCS
jgi:ATP-dependent Lhr-like helicase